MDYKATVLELKRNRKIYEAILSGLNREMYLWKPGPDKWCLLEVVCHLYDEEREDFRVRLDVILNDPQKPWPPIDPQGWIKSRNYNERYLDESLQKFLSERDHSLAWLKNLGNPDWYSEYPAPFGTIRAGDIFAAWVTHDHLHMRQLVELQRALTLTKVSPFILDYAGDW